MPRICTRTPGRRSCPRTYCRPRDSTEAHTCFTGQRERVITQYGVWACGEVQHRETHTTTSRRQKVHYSAKRRRRDARAEQECLAQAETVGAVKQKAEPWRLGRPHGRPLSPFTSESSGTANFRRILLPDLAASNKVRPSLSSAGVICSRLLVTGDRRTTSSAQHFCAIDVSPRPRQHGSVPSILQCR